MVKSSNFPHRIRNSLIIYLMSSIVAFLVLLGLIFFILSKDYLDEEMGKRLIAIAALTKEDFQAWQLLQIREGDGTSRTYRSVQRGLQDAVDTGQVSRAYVFDLEDRSLVDTNPNHKPGTPYFDHSLYPSEMNKVRNGIPIHTPHFKGKDGNYYKKGFVPIVLDKKVVAVLGVQASADFFYTLRQIRRYLFYAILMMSLLIIAVSFILSEKIVHPIDELVTSVKKIGTGDLKTKVVLPYMNEFGLLGAAIDEMRIDLLEKEDRMQAMLQGIAHEIRNPLGGIELFTGLLQEELKEESEDQKQSVEKIQAEIINLKLIVEQFLDFARDPSPQPEVVKTKSFFEDIIASMQLVADNANVKLKLQLDDEIEEIWMDPRLMKRALLNLVHNAIQAMPSKRNGTVSLQVVKPEVGSIFAVEIRVVDDGKGIAESDLPHIFRPFYTTKEKGCGLGLAFCHKIVHSHGGQMRVDSALGKGSRMLMWLPPRHEPPNGDSSK